MTESESGNASATSGARHTVISEGAFRPGPRATTRSALKSYSRLSSSSILRLDFFGIDLSFTTACFSSTDNPDRLGSFCVGGYPQAPLLGLSHDDKPTLLRGVVRICKDQKQGIAEHRSCFVERYPVLGEIRFGLRWVMARLEPRSPTQQDSSLLHFTNRVKELARLRELLDAGGDVTSRSAPGSRVREPAEWGPEPAGPSPASRPLCGSAPRGSFPQDWAQTQFNLGPRRLARSTHVLQELPAHFHAASVSPRSRPCGLSARSGAAEAVPVSCQG